MLLYYYTTTVPTVLLYYCTATVLLAYYCTTTVLLLYYCTVPGSDFVDSGEDCRLEGKVFKVKGFLVVVVMIGACFRASGYPDPDPTLHPCQPETLGFPSSLLTVT